MHVLFKGDFNENMQKLLKMPLGPKGLKMNLYYFNPNSFLWIYGDLVKGWLRKLLQYKQFKWLNQTDKKSDIVHIILGLLNHWDIIRTGFPNEVC